MMGQFVTATVPLAACLALTACGASQAIPTTQPPSAPTAPPAPAPAPAAESASAPAAEPPPPLPTACATREGKVCLPESGFAARLCERAFPEVALAFFAKGTPWTRAYLRRDTEAWSAANRHARKARLPLDEEVTVVAMRSAPKNAIVVGSGASYDVLRFDGTCVSLEGDEIGFSRPPAPKWAAVPWDSLEPPTQSVLRAGRGVEPAVKTMQRACGLESTDEKKCQDAQRALSSTVFAVLGPTLPEPDRRPEGPERKVAARSR